MIELIIIINYNQLQPVCRGHSRAISILYKMSIKWKETLEICHNYMVLYIYMSGKFKAMYDDHNI